MTRFIAWRCIESELVLETLTGTCNEKRWRTKLSATPLSER